MRKLCVALADREVDAVTVDGRRGAFEVLNGVCVVPIEVDEPTPIEVTFRPVSGT
jgi:hypothetical protein